jgi:hypothetical protein
VCILQAISAFVRPFSCIAFHLVGDDSLDRSCADLFVNSFLAKPAIELRQTQTKDLPVFRPPNLIPIVEREFVIRLTREVKKTRLPPRRGRRNRLLYKALWLRAREPTV